MKKEINRREFLRNALGLAGVLGLSILGINDLYAQKKFDKIGGYQLPDMISPTRGIKEAERKEIVLGRLKDGTFVIDNPEYGITKVKDLSEYVSIMANSIKKSRENMELGVSILESELQRGYLSPERAKEARTALNKSIRDYEIVRSMYGNLHYNPKSPFKREVDFFAPDIREELIDTETGKRIPYPGKMIDDFSEFAKKYQLNTQPRSSIAGSYKGEIGGVLREALGELDEVIRRETQQEIKTRRYVPWSGFGERIDEFIHPGVGDAWEVGLGMAGALVVVGTVSGILVHKAEKREQEKDETSQKPVAEKPEPLPEVINPWDINLNNLNPGGKK